jgi:hypothetical protein
MGNRTLGDDDKKVLEQAAHLLIAGQPVGKDVERVLAAQFKELATLSPVSGGSGTIAWYSAMECLGTTISSIAKREKASFQRHGR